LSAIALKDAMPAEQAAAVERSAPDPQSNVHADAPAHAHVDMRNVSVVYGEGDDQMLAVDRLDIQVKTGQIIAVVGPSGCGKSTLMKLGSGLMLPDSGAVFIDGQRVTGPVRNVGMAFQNSTLMPWRTTLRNVMLPFEIVEPHKQRLRKNFSEYVGRAERLLEKVGLLEFANRFPWQLSGGMQQRASVCRALIHEPRLLMLDEPFGALDAFTREELWLMMQDLWLEKRFSAILVTHDLREAVFLADKVIVLGQRPGRVIMTRTVDLPRPRTIANTFEPSFVEIVQELRDKIVEARG
jgi:NitT/TauT family transport system ATP-binding protein